MLAAVATAEAALKSELPQASLLRTGARFLRRSRTQQAEREVDLIGGGSLAGIPTDDVAALRSVRPLALRPSSPSPAVALCCRGSPCDSRQDPSHHPRLRRQPIGEAVDYAIQYLPRGLTQAKRWQPEAGLAHILPGLAAALATSLVGYGALNLTPLPGNRPDCLFAFAGLAAAWVSVALFLRCFAEHRACAMAKQCGCRNAC